MGFFDKIKGTLQQITGGAGNMQLQLGSMQVKRGESISFTATLNSTGALKGKSVTAEIVANEHIKYKADVPDSTQAAGATSVSTHQEDRTTDTQTYENQQVLMQAELELPEGQSKQFTGTLLIPATAQPTYTGPNAQHTWQVRVWLDVPMGADITATADFVVL